MEVREAREIGEVELASKQGKKATKVNEQYFKDKIANIITRTDSKKDGGEMPSVL
jgi:hypothetical protein